MRQTWAFIGLVVLVTAVAAFPSLPGTDHVGYGFDGAKTEAFGSDITPKRPIIKFTWCNASCYTPEHRWDPGCEDCEFSFDPATNGTTYRVPREVMASLSTVAGGCYENYVASHVDDYIKHYEHTSHHSSWFGLHQKTKTTVDFYRQYFEADESLSLNFKYLDWFTLALPPPEFYPFTLSFEFTMSVKMLPDTYDNSTDPSDPYMQLLSEYGSHYMDRAVMGGMAYALSFFHSCFLEEQSFHFVSEQSGWNFFNIIKDITAGGHYHNKTSTQYDEWSQTNCTIIGGFADQFPQPTRNATWAPGTLQSWEDTVKYLPVPLRFSLTPISELVTDPVKKANLVAAIEAYAGAVHQENLDLEAQLKPHDPYIKPDWCGFSPKPPFSPGHSSSSASTTSSGGTEPGPQGLPGCPALPSPYGVGVEMRARHERRLLNN